MVQYKRTCLFRKLAVRYDRILAEVTNYAYKTFRGYASWGWAELGEALKYQAQEKERLGTTLVKHNYITEKQLIDTLRIQLGIEYIDLSKVDITPEMSRYVPKPGENIIQTAPYYDEDGNVGKIQGQNPFGPRK